MKSLLLMAGLFILSTAAHAASECEIKEIREVTGKGVARTTLKTEVAVALFDNCLASAKELLGRKEVGTYTFTRASHSGRILRRVDDHALFTTHKVIMKYRGDDTQGEKITVKFKK